MEGIEFAAAGQTDLKSLESLLQGFYDKNANTDPIVADTNSIFGSSASLWDTTEYCATVDSPFSFDLDTSSSIPTSPSSSASSPVSSPTMYQLPSSPQDSSSDEQEMFSNNNNFVFPADVSFTDFSSLVNGPDGRPIFNFDPVLLKASESAFQKSCLPPLPLATPIPMESAPVKAEPAPKKNAKKRKRPNNAKEIKFAKLDLSEEELLKFTASEMEDYIKAVSGSKTLSPSEEKELKRVRRLIKNREYAQSSRDKRKQYMEEMEGQINAVQQEKAVLQQRVDSLEMENKALKFHLSKILKSSTVTGSSPRSAAVNKTAAITFFVVLFSFGFFAFNSGGVGSITGAAPSQNFDAGHSFAPKGFKGRFLLQFDLPESQPTFVNSVLPTFLRELFAGYAPDSARACAEDPHSPECLAFRQQGHCVDGVCA
eukprot:TRINITY_DN324_c0_g1_i1.p1 TRINITY_DN324_c0_g1~~TRINITY_DN324_c0_g1_i1.p1  ORF type:complete len:427 (-),score=133.24 TRINITY_DN324_c0_g1_i1:102-1382(-)